LPYHLHEIKVETMVTYTFSVVHCCGAKPERYLLI
jgi:hypothetical protein